MIDISSKYSTLRTAAARSTVRMQSETVNRVRGGTVPKGDPLPVARVAAIQAVKNTSAIIPFCHPLPVDHVAVDFDVQDTKIVIEVIAKAIYKTGVEMEAMTGAAVAALTIYDMLKMLDDTMSIEGVELLWKKGGKSEFREDARGLTAAVLVTSDSVADGKKQDRTGPMIKKRLEDEGLTVASYDIIPDDQALITQYLTKYADSMYVDLVLSTGGTGFSPRDFTPEATRVILEREAPGITEYLRAFGQARTPWSMLSRSTAGVRGSTLIINLPGSRGGVKDALDALFPGVLHTFKMLKGMGHPSREKQQ